MTMLIHKGTSLVELMVSLKINQYFMMGKLSVNKSMFVIVKCLNDGG